MVLDLKGNTYQASTTGKNMFDKDNYTSDSGYIDNTGAVATSNTSRHTTSLIKVKPNTTYTFSGGNLAGGFRFNVNCYNNSQEFVQQQGYAQVPMPFTFTTNATTEYIGFNYYTSRFTPSTLQIEEGNQATPYEPYTGTQPTPNPDYPMDIHCVSGDNAIFVHKANYFDYDSANPVVVYQNNATKVDNGFKGGWSYRFDLPYTLKAGTYHLKFTVEDANNSSTAYFRFYTRDGQGLASTICHTSVDLDIVLIQDASYIRVDNGLNATTTLIKDIIISKNKIPYEPYTAQVQLISLGAENVFDKENIN
jgi:hypothetical protein